MYIFIKEYKYIDMFFLLLFLFVPILLGRGTNIGLYWFPPASPIVSCQGGNKFEQNTCFMS